MYWMKTILSLLIIFSLAVSINAQSNCATCELIVNFVESYVASNASQQQIIQGLEVFCSLLGPAEQQCDQIVEQYVPVIIQYINAQYSPQEICTILGFCTSGKRGYTPIVKARDNQLCTVCLLIVQVGETYLQNNGTKQQLEAFLDAFPCSWMGSLVDSCVTFINNYVPQAVDWLVQNEPPQVVCSQMGLCTSK